MKRMLIIALVAAGMLAAVSVRAADTKVGGETYLYWVLDKSDSADNANTFGLERAYIDIKSKLTDYTSARATLDVKQISGYSGYTMILKYGYLDFKPKFGKGWLDLRFGLQPTLYIDNMQGLWGRRYALKVISDNKGLLTSADLGASALVDLSKDQKYGFVQLAVWNGGSYSDVTDKNKNKNASVFLHLNVAPNNEDFKRSQILAQYMYGTQNKAIPDTASGSDFKSNLLEAGGMLGYRNTFDLGLDLNWLTKSDTSYQDVKSTGYSFFGALYFVDFVNEVSPLRTLNLFGRVDAYDPNTDVSDDGETLVVVGLECAPSSGVKASVSYRNTSYQAADEPSMKTINFNTLVKF